MVTSKFDKDLFKNERTTLETPFSHYKSMGIFFTLKDDGRPLVYYKITLWAFGSGELKIWKTTQKKQPEANVIIQKFKQCDLIE